MREIERKLDAVFFRTARGNEPVREWLLSLTKAERKQIGDAILKVHYCWPIGKPLVDHVRTGLWDVRSRIEERIARVIFCVDEHRMVRLHGFIKKTQKTRKHELEVAIDRAKQLR